MHVFVLIVGEALNADLKRLLRLLLKKDTSCTKEGEDCYDDVSLNYVPTLCRSCSPLTSLPYHFKFLY